MFTTPPGGVFDPPAYAEPRAIVTLEYGDPLKIAFMRALRETYIVQEDGQPLMRRGTEDPADVK